MESHGTRGLCDAAILSVYDPETVPYRNLTTVESLFEFTAPFATADVIVTVEADCVTAVGDDDDDEDTSVMPLRYGYPLLMALCIAQVLPKSQPALENVVYVFMADVVSPVPSALLDWPDVWVSQKQLFAEPLVKPTSPPR